MSQTATEPAPPRTRAGPTTLPAEADDETLAALAAGSPRARTLLLDRYRGLARHKAGRFFLQGGDRDDVLQEALIGLYKAIRDFDPDAGASFRSFAELCITRQILTAVRRTTRRKHEPLNSYLSLTCPVGTDGVRTLAETLAGPDGADPLEEVVGGDDLRRLQRVVDAALSDLEADVLELYVEGRSYRDIAGRLDRHVKAVDNALQRVKRKLADRLAPAG